MNIILIFSAFFFISDAYIPWKNTQNVIGLIEVNLWSSASIKCDLLFGDNVYNSSHIKVVTWHKNNSKDPIYR